MQNQQPQQQLQQQQQKQQFLEFTSRIPTMARVHKSFPVSFQLRKKNLKEPSTSSEARIAIVFCDDGSEFNDVAIVDDLPNNSPQKNSLTVTLQDNCMKTVNIKFASPCTDRKLKVVVSPTTSGGSMLDAIESPSFSVVEYYLHVKTEMLYPYVFYKDVGGKDSGILLTVHLKKSTLEESDPDVTTRTVSFRPSLQYEDGNLVPDQKILQSFTGAHSFMISASGPSLLKFRINEVSSKHRNLRFCIVMEHFVPDGSNEPLNIAPGASEAIEIRSKVNHHTMKRRIREVEEQMQEQQDAQRQASEPAYKRFVNPPQHAPIQYPPQPPQPPAPTPFIQPPMMPSAPVALKTEDTTTSTSMNFLKVHNDFEELVRCAEKVIRMAKVYGPFDPTFENTLRNLENSLPETSDDLVFLLKFHRNGQPSNTPSDRPSAQPSSWNQTGSYGQPSLRGVEYSGSSVHESSEVQRPVLGVGALQWPSSLRSFPAAPQNGSSLNHPLTSFRNGPLPTSLSLSGLSKPNPNYGAPSLDSSDVSGGRVTLVQPLLSGNPTNPINTFSTIQQPKHADAPATSSDGSRLSMLAEVANSNRG